MCISREMHSTQCRPTWPRGSTTGLPRARQAGDRREGWARGQGSGRSRGAGRPWGRVPRGTLQMEGVRAADSADVLTSRAWGHLDLSPLESVAEVLAADVGDERPDRMEFEGLGPERLLGRG